MTMRLRSSRTPTRNGVNSALILPYYDRYVVTASADCPDAFGYCDFALGAFALTRRSSKAREKLSLAIGLTNAARASSSAGRVSVLRRIDLQTGSGSLG